MTAAGVEGGGGAAAVVGCAGMETTSSLAHSPAASIRGGRAGGTLRYEQPCGSDTGAPGPSTSNSSVISSDGRGVRGRGRSSHNLVLPVANKSLGKAAS